MLAIVWFDCDLCNASALTENQIVENLKYLSRNNVAFEPSRLRALLVSDLKNVLIQRVCIRIWR